MIRIEEFYLTKKLTKINKKKTDNFFLKIYCVFKMTHNFIFIIEKQFQKKTKLFSCFI